jgi:Leucine-rich repeat (LRR) protein
MTKRGPIFFIVLLVTMVTCLSGYAQKKKPVPAKQKPKTTQSQSPQKSAAKTSKPASTQTKADGAPKASDEENEKKVRDIVAFLEYLLNTLGSSSTSTRDKDVVIRESYAKIFRDDKVQIEDDLENREVVTNKDVVAYLKDVDFFFTDVRFEFNIESIQGGGTDNNKVFYKVALQRNMKGTSLEGAEVNATIPRFIEVNYDPDADGLKIVSMYTKGFDEKVALTAWWNDLSYEWRSIFQRKLDLMADSLSFTEIQRAASIDSLDLSNNPGIRSLEPLAQLTRLRYLNLSSTAINDLTPIRNLTALTDLSVSATQITDLQAIRYAAEMRHLDISHTAIHNADPLQKMIALQWLDASDSQVADLAPLAGLVDLRFLSLRRAPAFALPAIAALNKLEHLNIASTGVTDIAAIAGMQRLVSLNIDSTRIRDLRPLANMTSLKEISANYSRIDNIEPLKTLPSLERIYCDHTQIVRSVADAFMTERPGVLIIYDSKDLMSWWESIGTPWRTALLPTNANPSKDDLARLANIDSLNLRNVAAINGLEPVKRFPRLTRLNLSGTGITDISPLRDLKEVVYLDISHTEVVDVGPLRMWKNLTTLHASNTKIQNIDPLASLGSLKELVIDDTGIHDLHAREFLARNPNCLLVYKTYHVQRWWSRLTDSWKSVFVSILKKPEPGAYELHRLVEMTSIAVVDVAVDDLTTLSEFVRLEELRLSGTSVKDLSPLSGFNDLKTLHVTNSPVKDIQPLGQVATLTDVDLSGTAVEDLKPLRGLTNLKKLNCSGTLVRKLDALEHLSQLEYLDCSNTSVSNLDPLEKLPLKTVKCFNSRVSKREVERLKARGIDVVSYR